jgi:hypothetical protein
VLEIAGEITEFVNAVRRIGSLEWLLEQTEDDVDPDEEFATVSRDGERKAYGRQLFVLASDAAAWQQLLSLWDIYQEGGAFPRGLTKFRDLFARLKEVRPWDDRDRLLRAGAAEAWQRDLADLGDELVPFEAELWLRHDPERREMLRNEFAAELQAAGGELLHELVLEEISYHGLLGRVPAWLLLDAAARREVRWMSTGNVRLFHAAGQAAFPPPGELEVYEHTNPNLGPPTDAPPRVAILDGLPVENHDLLAGRLIIDDPDDWAATTPAANRIHGTAMASIALHGDLSDPQQPPRERIYLRPILRYEAPAWVTNAQEEIPADRLVVDVIHNAVNRMLEGDSPAAPNVRVICLSVGDRSQQFDRFVSPWARLLDWLAFRHGVLFLVSAGNHPEPLHVPADVDFDDAVEVQRQTLESIRRDALSRRLLAPAESVNAVTVGAAHSDGWDGDAADGRVDPLHTVGLASVISPTTSGFRRSIKPEILLPGGRQLVRPAPAASGAERALDVVETSRAPGLLAAAPDPAAFSLNRTAHSCGTSGANAMGVRGALTILEQLDQLRDFWGEQFPGPQFDAVLVKAALAHTASWGAARDAVSSMLAAAGEASGRASIARFLGYGVATPPRSLGLDDDTRITALYAGEILEGDADHYTFPLPPALAGSTIERRLTFTLAWLTPVNAGHRNYRRAALKVEPADPSDVFGDRDEADAMATRRGTLQHEVLRGANAVPYLDGATAEFVVSCRADAGELENPVPYAFVVSLEVPIETHLPIYAEIRERLAIRVPVRPQR